MEVSGAPRCVTQRLLVTIETEKILQVLDSELAFSLRCAVRLGTTVWVSHDRARDTAGKSQLIKLIQTLLIKENMHLLFWRLCPLIG